MVAVFLKANDGHSGRNIRRERKRRLQHHPRNPQRGTDFRRNGKRLQRKVLPSPRAADAEPAERKEARRGSKDFERTADSGDAEARAGPKQPKEQRRHSEGPHDDAQRSQERRRGCRRTRCCAESRNSDAHERQK